MSEKKAHSSVHPTAIIDGKVILAEGVDIGPYCHIVGPVTIGKNTTIASFSLIKGPVEIGEDNRINPHCIIGTEPESKGESSTGEITIGNCNIFTEFTVVTHGTMAAGTRIGDRNYFLNNVHVSHDCLLGNDITVAHNAVFGGHVTVQDGATIGIGVAVHQKSTIGAYCMVGMNSTITKDVPPLAIVFGNPAKFHRWNSYQLEKLGMTDTPLGELYEQYSSEFNSFSKREVLEIPNVGTMISDD